MLEYELGHVQAVAALFEQHEKRDAAEILDAALPRPIEYVPHREFVREVLRREVGFGSSGADLVANREDEPERTREYRAHLNRDDQPSNIVSGGWSWQPGGELAAPVAQVAAQRKRNANEHTSRKASS